MDISEIIPSVTAIAAILLSVIALWKTYLQKGRIRVVPPRSFALQSNQEKTYLLLPLLFYNSGALPVLIYNLRLRLVSKNQGAVYLYFSAIKQGFYGDANGRGPSDYRVPAVAFPVMGGRDARTIYCEFQSLTLSRSIDPDSFQATLERTEAIDGEWAELAQFPIYFIFKDGFIHENDPRSLRAWTRKETVETTLPDGGGSKSFIKT